MWKYMDKNIYFLPIPDSPFILMKYNTGSCHKPGHFSTEWAEISDLQTTIALGKWGDFLYDWSTKDRTILPNAGSLD